jgi:tetratricopeptide (TPR) repeat protein
LRQAVAAVEKTAPYDQRHTKSLAALAEFLIERGRLMEAETPLLRLLALETTFFGEGHSQLVPLLGDISDVAKRRGRYRDSERYRRKSLAANEDAALEHSANIALDLQNLADLARLLGRSLEAQDCLDRAFKIHRIVFGADSVLAVPALGVLADLFLSRGRTVEARVQARRCLTLLARAFGEKHPDAADVLDRLGRIDEVEGRRAEAETFFKKSLDMRRKLFGDGDERVALSLLNLSRCALRDHPKKALALAEDALDLRRRLLPPGHYDIAWALAAKAEAEGSLDQFEEAESAYQTAWMMFEKSLGAETPAVARCLNNLAELYYRRAAFEEADRLLEKSLAVTSNVFGEDHPETLAVLRNIAVSLDAQDRHAEAQTLKWRIQTLENKVK